MISKIAVRSITLKLSVGIQPTATIFISIYTAFRLLYFPTLLDFTNARRASQQLKNQHSEIQTTAKFRECRYRSENLKKAQK